MSRYFPERKDATGNTRGAMGIDGPDKVKLSHPPYLGPEFVPWNGQRDIGVKVDRAQGTNGGYSGQVSRSTGGRWQDGIRGAAPHGKSRALPSSFNRPGQSGNQVTRGRRGY